MLIPKYLILQMSEYAQNLLSSFHTGTIHSVYRKTINLQFNGQLLALQSRTSPVSPISLITDLADEELETLNLSAGMTVAVFPVFHHSTRQNLSSPSDQSAGSPAKGSLLIQLDDSVIFSSEIASVCDLHFASVLSEYRLQKLEKLCLEAFCLRNAGSFELLFSAPERAMEIPFLKAAFLRIDTAKKALQNKNWELAADTLCHLIGLGLGLTPGGDDFLCGVLAGLILIQPESGKISDTELLSSQANSIQTFREHLSRNIYQHLADTNDISAAFLRCALDHQFALAINNLPQFSDARKLLSALSEIGHSSGTDTLCGIYFILSSRHVFKQFS